MSWQSEHTFRHNWETVVQAAARKYPNPFNQSVKAIDIIDRRLCPQTGVLHSNRLIATEWAIALKFGTVFANEHSAIDARQRRMVLQTRNLSLSSLLTADERLEYSVHPDNKDWTLLKQSVEVKAFPGLASKLVSISEANAGKGREAIEWVINTQLDQPLLDFLSADLGVTSASKSLPSLHSLSPPDPGELIDSCVARVRAELDDLSTKAVKISRDLGDELTSFVPAVAAATSDIRGEEISHRTFQGSSPSLKASPLEQLPLLHPQQQRQQEQPTTNVHNSGRSDWAVVSASPGSTWSQRRSRSVSDAIRDEHLILF